MIPFEDWLQDVVNDEIVSIPSDINSEAQANLWTFSLSTEQVAVTSVEEWESFVRAVIDAKKDALEAQGFDQGAYTFYCWHDKMAAQFRFSLISSNHGRLPFVSAIKPVPELREIVSGFIGSQYHDGIPWEEFVENPIEEPEVYPPVEVWTVQIP